MQQELIEQYDLDMYQINSEDQMNKIIESSELGDVNCIKQVYLFLCTQ